MASPNVVNVLDDNADSVVDNWLRNFDESDSDEECNIPLNQLRRLEPTDVVSEVEDNCEESDHHSDSELSASSDDEDNITESITSSNYFYGKNRFKWSRIPPARTSRTQSHNILRLPSVRNANQEDGPLTPLQTFDLIFEGQMNVILQWTNAKLQQLQNKYPSDPYTFRQTNQIEIKGFLSLLMYSASFKSNRESVLALFATDGTGRNIFRATLSKKRFLVLLTALRFDDFENREERRLNDPGCAITEILELFNTNSRQHYVPGANMTVDEMLIAFRGRCKFKMYIPSKPAKYGLKLQVLADSSTFYVYNTYLYTGKGSDGTTLSTEEKKKSIPTQAVLRLCKPIYNTNRNITTDNWYSSIELAEELKSRGLTTVGTVKKNKAVIPREFLPNNARMEKSSLFGFTKDCTLVSHVPKKRKAVILYSTMHYDNKINLETQKPEIIEYYNATKAGVDAVDQKCAVYSCSRRTPRWPMAIFFRILDMTTWNSFVIYQKQTGIPTITRLNYVKALASHLNETNLKTRLYNTILPRQLRATISEIIQVPLPPETANSDQKLARSERKVCHICPWRLRRKTAYLCYTCSKPVCLSCTRKICSNCVEKTDH